MNNNLEQVKGLLPPVVLQIAKLIGFPATEKLIKSLGGVQLLMAKDLKNIDEVRRNILIKSIGEEKAKMLSDAFGGENIYIPRCEAALRELRNQSLLKDIDNLKMVGYSTTKAMTVLCPEYGISTRHAIELLKKRNASLQYSIF